jgi:hypothetical protein
LATERVQGHALEIVRNELLQTGGSTTLPGLITAQRKFGD